MIFTTALIVFFTSIVYGRPNADFHNVAVAPPNCPPNQVLINGKCRDVWLMAQPETSQTLSENIPINTVIAPDNCPPGQKLINGACRNIFWRQKLEGFQIKNAITVPPNCPPGQQLVNGQCRDIWLRKVEVQINNAITAPPNCKPGQQLINGKCRDVWLYNIMPQASQEPSDFIVYTDVDGLNIIDVPSQCPKGFKPDANGICRPILG